MVTVVITISCDPLVLLHTISCDPVVLLHTIIQHITYVHMHLFPHMSLCVPARWCRGDLHRCLCEGAQWTHLWCNIDQGILNCLLLLVPSSIPLTSIHLFQRDSDPKEIFLNLYGIHCDPNASFQWEKIAGASTILPSTCKYSLLLNCTVVHSSFQRIGNHWTWNSSHSSSHTRSEFLHFTVCVVLPIILNFLATEFLLKVRGRLCSSCREMTSKCTCTEKNGDSQRYVCVQILL